MTKTKTNLLIALALTTALTPLAVASPARANVFEDLVDIATAPVEIVIDGVEEVVDVVDKVVVEPLVDPVLEAAENTIDDVLEIGEDTVKAAVALSGLKTLEDVLIEGKSLDDSLKEVLDDAKTGITSVAAAPMVMNHFSNAGTEVVGNVLGKEAGKAVAMLKLPQQIINALPAAMVETLISTSENGENGERVVGIPLNAALKQAHQYYEAKAVPLPPRVVKMLTVGGADPALIANARYVVDDGSSSVPAIINYLMTHLGEKSTTNHAVTVGNIIVFANQPGETIKDLYFWAHELQHTAQYADKGFDGFASDYTTDHSAIEQNADDVATAVYTKVKDVLVVLAG